MGNEWILSTEFLKSLPLRGRAQICSSIMTGLLRGRVFAEDKNVMDIVLGKNETRGEMTRPR